MLTGAPRDRGALAARERSAVAEVVRRQATLGPGVITQSTVLVEHPARFASVVGRERVIAGADCGFASFAGSAEIHPTIVWAKLAALVEGAHIATRQLRAGDATPAAPSRRTAPTRRPRRPPASPPLSP